MIAIPERLLHHHQVVYLIHLDRPLSGRAQHYLGYSSNLEGRLFYHRTGRGSRFLAAANAQNISYQVVKVWEGGGYLEPMLKKRKNHKKYCPICNKKLYEYNIASNRVA